MGAAAVSAGLFAYPPPALREAVRQTLIAEPHYETLDAEDRRAIAHSLVRIAHAARLLEAEAAAPGPAGTPVRLQARAMNASDELGGRAVASMAGTTRQMINAISFPRFVNELITGVFKAMLETNQQQLQQYVELVRGVSQSLDGFSALGGGTDDNAKRWLADQFPQSYAIEQPDPDDPPDPDDEPQPLQLVTRGAAPSEDALRAALSLEPGEAVPSGAGPELFAFVRRSLARNRQQMLATMIQMGMQRIVVDSGRISAGMRFHIDATSAAAEQRHSGFDTRTTIGASASASFGWWSASASVNSTIGYVQTTDTQTREEVNASADLTSSVELHFRTDQVPLDRIASQQTVERLRLNTLNPEKELAVQAQTDQARISANQALETARAARPSAPFAPTAAAGPAAPPPSAGAAKAPANAPVTDAANRATGASGAGTTTPTTPSPTAAPAAPAPKPAAGAAPAPSSGEANRAAGGTAASTTTPSASPAPGASAAPALGSAGTATGTNPASGNAVRA